MATSSRRTASTKPRRTLTFDDPLLTVDEAADYLGITSRKVRRMVTQRAIEYVKLGKLVRIRRSACDAVIAAGTIAAET